MRTRLIHLEEKNGIVDPRLRDEPQVWVAGKHALDYFWELCPRRQMHSMPMGGVMPGLIAHETIESWARNKKIDLSPWDVLAIESLDAVYLEHSSKSLKKPDAPAGKK